MSHAVPFEELTFCSALDPPLWGRSLSQWVAVAWLVKAVSFKDKLSQDNLSKLGYLGL